MKGKGIFVIRDLFFLAVIIVLLAVISFTGVTTLNTVRHDLDEHRLRNEAENLCQIEVISQHISLPTDWVRQYEDCVNRRSGTPAPPIKP